MHFPVDTLIRRLDGKDFKNGKFMDRVSYQSGSRVYLQGGGWCQATSIRKIKVKIPSWIKTINVTQDENYIPYERRII